MRKEQASNTTYCGHSIAPMQKGLPKQVRSICPECIRVIAARLYEEDGRVMMEKTCPEHGYFKDIYWSDVDLYLKAEKWFFSDGRGLENPMSQARNCPQDCGLCQMHTSHTALGNIDLTNRCNMKCPICFASSDASGHIYEPSYEEVVGMLKLFRQTRPVAGRTIQFSGGEPTLHPRLFDILRAADDLGFSHIQMATNGLLFAEDPEFAQKCEEAGLDCLYLQFDGLSDKVYVKTRGRPLADIKQKAVENIAKTDMKIALVPTIVKGINDHEIGNIVRYAIKYRETISGISFQPVAFTGRIDHQERMARRFTLSDLAHAVDEQTGITRADRDWYPLSCVVPFTHLVGATRGEETINITCHPHCAFGTYLFIDSNGRARPVLEFMDVEKMLSAMNKIAHRTKPTGITFFGKLKAFHTLHKYFNAKKAPEELDFRRFLLTLEGMINKNVGRGEAGKKTFRTMMLAGMHFMDGYNYELERVSRCVIHFATPEGRLYPFCAYNSGPYHRARVERQYAKTHEEWRQRLAGAREVAVQAGG